jgi:hypothetical protein
MRGIIVMLLCGCALGGLRMKKKPILTIVGVALLCIIIKTVFESLEQNVSTFFGWIIPLVNGGSALILGILLYDLAEPSRLARTLLLAVFVAAHFSVYSSSYVISYYNIRIKTARSNSISYGEASERLDSDLREETGSGGFIGYLKYVAKRGMRPLNADDVPDDLPDVILFAMLRLFQLISINVLHLHVAGLIEMCFWYLVTWGITLVGPPIFDSAA